MAAKSVHKIVDELELDHDVDAKMRECIDIFMKGRVIKSHRRDGILRLLTLSILAVRHCLDVPYICDLLNVSYQDIKTVLGHPSSSSVLEHLGINDMSDCRYVRGTIATTCKYLKISDEHIDTLNGYWDILTSFGSSDITSSMYVTIVCLVTHYAMKVLGMSINRKHIATVMRLSPSTISEGCIRVEKLLE